MRGRRFVITSTNAQRAAEIIGADAHIIEIVGKPFDIELVVKTVQSAAGRNRLPDDARRV